MRYVRFYMDSVSQQLADRWLSAVVLQSKSIGSLVSKMAILLVVIYFSLAAFHIPKNRIFVKVAAPLLLVPLSGCFRTSWIILPIDHSFLRKALLSIGRMSTVLKGTYRPVPQLQPQISLHCVHPLWHLVDAPAC